METKQQKQPWSGICAFFQAQLSGCLPAFCKIQSTCLKRFCKNSSFQTASSVNFPHSKLYKKKKKTSGREKYQSTLNNCCCINVPAERREERGGKKTKNFFGLSFLSHIDLTPMPPLSPHLEVTPAQSQREQKRAAHQRLFFVSEELKDPWNKPPGSRHSAFLTVCSFEGAFKAVSERKCACHLGGRHFFPSAWVTKIQGNGRDKIRVGIHPILPTMGEAVADET